MWLGTLRTFLYSMNQRNKTISVLHYFLKQKYLLHLYLYRNLKKQKFNNLFWFLNQYSIFYLNGILTWIFLSFFSPKLQHWTILSIFNLKCPTWISLLLYEIILQPWKNSRSTDPTFMEIIFSSFTLNLHTLRVS